MTIANINLTSGMRSTLISLQQTSKVFEITQNRLATGLKVNSALDDPVAFFAAELHSNRASDLAIRKNDMNEAIQTIKAANNGIEGVTTLIESAKSIAQSALSAEDQTEADSLAAQYDAILAQIDFLVEDSGYKGTNLLADGSLEVKFDENGDSTVTVDGFDATYNAGLGISDATGVWDVTDDTTISGSITELDDAKTTLRTQTKNLATDLNVITARQEFTAQMINVLNDGAAKLTEADMNEEGAKMLMLQTQQALGTTSLSLASQAAQSVLRLF
jgi:flagellin-like hook-associated protein FlgL